MKTNTKKVFLGLGALLAAVAVLPMFAAFEAHVVNVTASIENALSVPVEAIDFNTVFPQEKIDKTFDISLSGSFLNQSRVDKVNYMIRQKPKCQRNNTPSETTLPSFGLATEDGEGNFICVDEVHYDVLPLLCPYLSKHELTPDGQGENDSVGINAFHGLPGPWTMTNTLATQVLGMLDKTATDNSDTWNIDLRVPCFRGSCAQDWPEFVRTESGNQQIDPEIYKLDPALQGKLLGCDLWVEVTGIGTSTPAVTTGTITVVKQVTNDNGGNNVAGDFSLFLNGNPVTSGVPVVLAAGSYTVTETGVNGYQASFSGNCDVNGVVNLAAGQNLTCTLTNNDIAPTITVVKSVVGGSAVPTDFTLLVNGSTTQNNSSVVVNANTPHSISELENVLGYVFTSMTGTSAQGVSCPATLGGTITLAEGDAVVCTITNTLNN